jgi:hypothetical protein
VSNEDDLATISKLPGASGIETIDEPGGGKRVRLMEPNGYKGDRPLVPRDTWSGLRG